MVQIAAIGDNCVDVYTNLGRSYPGGGPVNFAVQARRAGAQSAYIGVLGQDVHGDWIAGALAAEGVDLHFLARLPGPTAVAFVFLDGAERKFLGSDHGVRGLLRVTPEMAGYLAGFDLVHTTLDGGVDAHLAGWHARGLRISYDFSHRAKPAQLDLLPCIDVAFFSGRSMPDGAEAESLMALQQRGVPLAVMTLGAEGSLAYDGRRLYRQAALPARCVDSLGAGDAFQAGFMVSYLRHASVATALEAGARLAAAAIESYGGFGYEHDSQAPQS